MTTARGKRAPFPALPRFALPCFVLPRFVLDALLLQCPLFSLSQNLMLGTKGINSNQQQCTGRSRVLPVLRTAHALGIKRSAGLSVNSTTRGWLRGAFHRYNRRTPSDVLRDLDDLRTSLPRTVINPR